jgi:hypothetical protein
VSYSFSFGAFLLPSLFFCYILLVPPIHYVLRSFTSLAHPARTFSADSCLYFILFFIFNHFLFSITAASLEKRLFSFPTWHTYFLHCCMLTYVLICFLSKSHILPLATLVSLHLLAFHVCRKACTEYKKACQGRTLEEVSMCK